MLEPIEYLVDRRERLQLDIGLDLAFGGEGERFGHIVARADERTADGYAVRHYIEQRNRKFARRQSDQDTSAALPRHPNTLLECDQRRSRYQNAMGSAAGLLLHAGCGVSRLGIDRRVGADLLGVSQLGIVDIDGADE